MINNDSVVTAYDEHLTLVEWLQKVEVLLKNGGLKETILNDKGNATFSLTLVFNDGSKIESNAMTLESVNTALASVNTALRNLRLDLNTESHRIDDLEDQVDNKTIPLFDKYSIIVPNDSADTNILPCTPSDNGKVLSVVNGEAQWASAGGGGTLSVSTYSYNSKIPTGTHNVGEVIILSSVDVSNAFGYRVRIVNDGYSVSSIEIDGVIFLPYTICQSSSGTINVCAMCIKGGTISSSPLLTVYTYRTMLA